VATRFTKKKDLKAWQSAASRSCLDIDGASIARQSSSLGADPWQTQGVQDGETSGQGVFQILYRARSHSAGERKGVDAAESPAVRANIEVLATCDSGLGKSIVEADDATEGGVPTEGVNRARGNKIVEDVHVAEATMRSEGM
jgi:hypothetical protein